MKYVSPGVYVREIDLSLYVPALSSTIAAMVGTAVKGPVNKKTFISSVDQYIKIFGNPDPTVGTFLTYAALQYLRRGSQLWVVRVAGSDAAAAEATVSAVKTALIESTASATSFTITAGTNDKFKVRVTDARVTPSNSYEDEITIPAVSGATISEISKSIAEQFAKSPLLSNWVTAVDYPYTGSTKRLGIAAMIASPSVSLEILTPSAASSLTTLGFSAGSSIADLGTVTPTVNGTAATTTYDYTVVARNGSAAAVATASTSTGPATVDGTNNISLAWVASTAATSVEIYRTRSSVTKLVATLAGDAASFTDNSEVVGSVFTGTLPVDSLGYAGKTGAGSFKVVANSVGTWGNNLSVQITQSKGFKFDIGVYEETPTAKANASKGFYGYRTELHRGASLDSTGYVPNDGIQGSYIADVLGTSQEAGRSGVLLFENAASNGIPTATRYIMPAVGVTELTGGTNGTAVGAALNAQYIGVAVDPSTGGPTGLQIFRNAEKTDLNILMVPGVADGGEEVLNELLAISEERGDTIAILDTPKDMTVQEVVDWHNGAGVYSDHQAFNSSYGAMYYDWIQIFDPYNAELVWTPPCGHVAAVYAWTDYIAETWFAPAGFNRAHITAAKQVGTSPDQGERELMYGNQNAINPIVQFEKDGITIWGQRTLQRKPSALDRVNVRRLMNYLKKVISTAVKYLTFEPNDSITWRSFVRLVKPFMQTIQAQRGVYAFDVKCDESTNPADQIDNNILTGKIFLQPVKAAEVIQVDFVLTPTGASFEEALY